MGAQEKRLTENRALLDAAAEDWQESLKDDVCTQGFAIEHQQQRIASVGSKASEFEAAIMKRLEENLEAASGIDSALEKRLTAELRSERERFEARFNTELEDVRMIFSSV